MKIVGRIHLGFLFLFIILQGCATMPAGPDRTGAATFSQGVMQVTYENTLFRTFEAARATLQEQEMSINAARRDADTGSIQAMRKDGTAVNVAFRSTKPDQTEVLIKIGAYGSEEDSRKISRGIEARLEKLE